MMTMQFSCQIVYQAGRHVAVSLTVMWLEITLIKELGLFTFHFRIWLNRWWEEEEKEWRGKQTENGKKIACQGNEWCLWPYALLQNHVAICLFIYLFVSSLWVKETTSSFVAFVFEVKLKPSKLEHYCLPQNKVPRTTRGLPSYFPIEETSYTCMCMFVLQNLMKIWYIIHLSCYKICSCTTTMKIKYT